MCVHLCLESKVQVNQGERGPCKFAESLSWDQYKLHRKEGHSLRTCVPRLRIIGTLRSLCQLGGLGLELGAHSRGALWGGLTAGATRPGEGRWPWLHPTGSSP